MFGIGPWELVIIFAIALLMFGGKRLPGLATGLGQAIRNFKSALNEPVPGPSSPNQLSSQEKSNSSEPSTH